jgi:hypothetical protein
MHSPFAQCNKGISGEDNMGGEFATTVQGRLAFPVCSPNSTFANLTELREISSIIF